MPATSSPTAHVVHPAGTSAVVVLDSGLAAPAREVALEAPLEVVGPVTLEVVVEVATLEAAAQVEPEMHQLGIVHSGSRC